jgi:hypothetical protein
MRRVSCVCFLLLALFVSTDLLHGQQPPLMEENRVEGGLSFQLEQNYPNPFNPETRIPFELFEDVFVDGRPATVSIRIYNLLLQYVGSATTVDHPAGQGHPILELDYPFPGRFEAHWDGRDRSGAPVASGVYILELTVNGRSQILKMFLTN